MFYVTLYLKTVFSTFLQNLVFNSTQNQYSYFIDKYCNDK